MSSIIVFYYLDCRQRLLHGLNTDVSSFVHLLAVVVVGEQLFGGILDILDDELEVAKPTELVAFDGSLGIASDIHVDLYRGMRT